MIKKMNKEMDKTRDEMKKLTGKGTGALSIITSLGQALRTKLQKQFTPLASVNRKITEKKNIKKVISKAQSMTNNSNAASSPMNNIKSNTL